MARLLICINELLIRHPFEACKSSICSVYEILTEVLMHTGLTSANYILVHNMLLGLLF